MTHLGRPRPEVCNKPRNVPRKTKYRTYQETKCTVCVLKDFAPLRLGLVLSRNVRSADARARCGAEPHHAALHVQHSRPYAASCGCRRCWCRRCWWGFIHDSAEAEAGQRESGGGESKMSACFLCSREHAVLPVVVNLVFVAAEGLMLHTQITLVFGTEETGPPCPPPRARTLPPSQHNRSLLHD